jgi:hypothetical protein
MLKIFLKIAKSERHWNKAIQNLLDSPGHLGSEELRLIAEGDMFWSNATESIMAG